MSKTDSAWNGSEPYDIDVLRSRLMDRGDLISLGSMPENWEIVDVHIPKAPWYVRLSRKPVIRFRMWRLSRRLNHMGSNSFIKDPGKIRGAKHVSIGQCVNLWNGVRVAALDPVGDQVKITIGDNVSIHAASHISAVRDVTIGSGVLIAPNCYITDHDHFWLDPDDPPRSSSRLLHARTEIGENVWLGEKVSVLKGVKIGRNSIVGCNSVVTRDIPPYSVAVGSPARVVRMWNNDLKAWVKV